MEDNSLVPANEIWYTTIDGKAIKLKGSIQAPEKKTKAKE